MKNIKSISPTLLLILLFTFQACSDKEQECDVDCTEEFRSVVVKIVDVEANPVALDSFTVINTANNRQLDMQALGDGFQLMRKTGTYNIFSDKYFEEYKQQQLEVKFSGYINGEEVVSEIYKVGADCCHVYYISGDQELELEEESVQ